jgi:hypothetical protein
LRRIIPAASGGRQGRVRLTGHDPAQEPHPVIPHRRRDETDAGKGLISIRAPLAQAVLGVKVREIVEAAEPLGEIEVIAVES